MAKFKWSRLPSKNSVCYWVSLAGFSLNFESRSRTFALQAKKGTYLNGGKMSVPLAMTSLRPCKFLVMSWSVWYHSMVGGGSPRATHSNRAPELMGATGMATRKQFPLPLIIPISQLTVSFIIGPIRRLEVSGVGHPQPEGVQALKY